MYSYRKSYISHNLNTNICMYYDMLDAMTIDQLIPVS